MLKNSPILQKVIVIAVAIQLVAFTRPETNDLVELQAGLFARSEEKFRESDNNKVAVIEAKARGIIREVKNFRDENTNELNGNSGVCVEFLSGLPKNIPKPKKDCYWVYFKKPVAGSKKEPALKLFGVANKQKDRESILAEWKGDKPSPAVVVVQSPQQAQIAETTKAVSTIPNEVLIDKEKVTRIVVLTASKPAGKSSGSADAQTAIALLNQAQAATSNTSSSSTCATCELAALGGLEFAIKAPTTRAMASQCSSLMNSKGKMGEGGRSLYKIMSEEKYVEHFTKSNALGSYCPKFNSLSKEQKLQAWTWFWTAIAQEESSCIVDKIHPTSYKKKNGEQITLNPREGYGFWALELDRNVRRWRGAACSDIGTVDGQARCSIDIIVKHQLSIGGTASGNIGYWGPIRREYKDHQLMPHMRRINLCF